MPHQIVPLGISATSANSTYLLNSGPAAAEQIVSMNEAALRGWHAALANRENAAAVALMIGDSITEGAGAITNWVDRVPYRLLKKLQARFPTAGVTGGIGYAAPFTAAGGPWADNPISAATGGQNTSYGLGRRIMQFGSAGQSYTFTFTGDAFDIIYLKYSSGGTFSVTVDGGAAVNVSTSGTLADGNRYTVSGLTVASHTVVVAYVSGGASFVGGGYGYNGDRLKGVQVWDGSHSSTQSSYFVDGANPRWIDNVTMLQPALVTIELGINDAYQTPLQTAAQYKTSLTTLITNIRAACTSKPSIVLVPVWDRGSQPNVPLEPWANFVQGCYDVALADGKVAVCDMQRRFGAGAPPPDYALVGPDNVHPSVKGASLVAEALTGFLTPR